MRPTARTLALLRSEGYTAQVVERFCPYSRRRIDLFSCIDIVAVRPGQTLGIQATSGANHSHRRDKAIAEPKLREWLLAGNRFEIWSWAKKGPRGKAKRWVERREEIRLEDLAEAVVPEAA